MRRISGLGLGSILAAGLAAATAALSSEDIYQTRRRYEKPRKPRKPATPLPDPTPTIDTTPESKRARRRRLARERNEPEYCPICAEPFRQGDPCATDIDMGQCHAHCLEGSPCVDLDTGEEIEGPIPSYPYERDR